MVLFQTRDFLDVAQLQANIISIEKEPFNLDEAFVEVFAILSI